MKLPALTLIPLLLGGCASLDSDYARYMRVDLQQNALCRGSSECYDLNLIIPSYHEHGIAAAYGIRPASYEWGPQQLVELLLEPPDQLYPVEQLGPQLYRIPVTRPTERVWYYLRQEYHHLYESGKGGKRNMP